MASTLQPTIPTELIRGHLDAIILNVLREGDNYGYGIYKRILELSGGRYEVKEASLYSALRRLEQGDLVRSYWGDETQGGRRKYYRITPQGEARYRQDLAQWRFAKWILSMLIEGCDDGA